MKNMFIVFIKTDDNIYIKLNIYSKDIIDAVKNVTIKGYKENEIIQIIRASELEYSKYYNI